MPGRGFRKFLWVAAVLPFAAGGALLGAEPDFYEPADHFDEAFRSAPDLNARLARVPELTLAHLSDGELNRLPDLFREVTDGEEAWHENAYRAEMFATLGDASAEYRERRAVFSENPEDAGLLDRLWDLAVRVEDWDGAVKYSGALAEVSGDPADRLDHWRLLIRRGKNARLLDSFERNEVSLFSLRELFPDLFEHDALDLANRTAEAAETRTDRDWRSLFALGEYALFNGDESRAVDRFRAVIALEENGGETAGVTRGFSRLNEAYFTRFAAMRNRALVTGEFGSRPALDYSFFGMRERFLPETQAEARDASVLYWKHIALARDEPRHFLDGLTEALGKAELPHGERILALAIAAAPRLMMAEIDRYLDSGIRDEGTDGFILRAVNRYAPSLAAFPELRDAMIDATKRIHRRLARGAGDEGPPEDLFRRRLNLLDRLGARDEVQRMIDDRREALAGDTGEEALRENLELAFDQRDLAAAERIFAKLQEADEDRDTLSGARYRDALLHLARWRWDETGDRNAAGAYLRDYLRSLEAGAGEPDGTFFSVRSWWASRSFPPGNPYWDGAVLPSVGRAIEPFLDEDRFDVLREAIEALATDRPAGERGSLRFLETCLLWWRGDTMAARINLTEAVEETDDPYLRFLAAFLAAREHRAEQAEGFLAGLPDGGDAGFQIAALRYLLAAGTDDASGRDRAAEALTVRDEREDARLAWAGVLIDEGYVREGMSLLRGIDSRGLGGRARDSYFAAYFAGWLRAGEPARAAALAERRLLRELPEDFEGIETETRIRALRVLENAARAEHYRAVVGTALEMAPDSFPLHLLAAESSEEPDAGSSGPRRNTELREAADLRKDDYDRQLTYARRLFLEGEPGAAVAVYDDLLEWNAPLVMVYREDVLDTYEAAGALTRLGAFFESWTIPQARSIDRFYGLQPTSPFLNALGFRLREQGHADAALRVWKTGVRINPVAFGEAMRVRLAKGLWQAGREEEYFAVIGDYLFRDELLAKDGLWAVHPFVAVAPQWLSAGYRDGTGRIVAPLLQMLEPLEASDNGLDALVDRARTWRAEAPGEISRRAFYVFALSLAGKDAARGAWRALQEERGPEGASVGRAVVIERLDEWLRALNGAGGVD